MLRPYLLAAFLGTLSTAARAGDGPKTTFTVHLENVSTAATLRSSSGATAPAPNSPGLWIVHTGEGVLFARGKPDRGAGLERQAEDGDPAPLAASLAHARGVRALGIFDTPVGDAAAGPALPGKAYHFSFEASPGQRLTLVTMFGQSNDVFYAPAEAGIPLFERGEPITGDITARLLQWDAGTEVNQEPGFGPDQAPRQARPDTGDAERSPVRHVEDVKDGFAYPPVGQVLRVTITAAPAALVN